MASLVFRNVAAHAYLELSLDDVWDIVEHHLAALMLAIEAELDRGGQ